MMPSAAAGRIVPAASRERPLAVHASLALLLPLVLLAVACEDEESQSPAGVDPVLPAAIEALGELPDTATAGAALAEPLRVRVTGTDGAPLADVPVAWRIVAGGGSLGADTTRTGGEGTAGVGWTLGTAVGQNAAAASVEGLAEVAFALTAGPGAPAVLTLSAETVTFFAVGESRTLAAAVADPYGNAIAGATLAWTSSDAAVATVDGAGKVMAKGAGTVRVVASAGAAADTTTVRVRQVPAAVIVTPAAATLYQDSVVQFTAVVADSNGVAIPGADVTWAAANAAVASVDAAGLVTAAREGEAAVTATSVESGIAAAAIVTVRGRIVFVSNRDGNNEIYVMNEDGTDAFRLTNDAADDTDPAWSPDGSRIAFASNRDGVDAGDYDIYVMNADGSGPILNVSQDAATDSDPAWSPDGSSIAFTSNRSGDTEVYIGSADGSGSPRNVTNDGADDFEPVWSPDGTRLLFWSDRDGDSEIYVMNADGSGVTNLTQHDSLDADPYGSPDGTEIAFASQRDGEFEIYIMDAAGTGVRRLTNNARLDVEPAWSADGEKVIFWRILADASREIFVVNADGTGPATNLTKHPADDIAPGWRPKP